MAKPDMVKAYLMNPTFTIKLPRSLVNKLQVKARKLGLSFEEYVLELTLRDFDPTDGVREYIEIAKELLEQSMEELEKGDVRQAAEKSWGAAALSIKAYAEWKDGERLRGHGDLWDYSKKLMEELGEWVSDAWAQAIAMHICLYEGWCSKEHVQQALKRISRFIEEISKRVQGVN